MIYVAVFFGCMIFGWLLASLIDLRPCGAKEGIFVEWECRALVGRRGHTRHVWEIAGAPIPIRPWSDYPEFRRNLAAVMAEERIAMSVRRPEDFVKIVSV